MIGKEYRILFFLFLCFFCLTACTDDYLAVEEEIVEEKETQESYRDLKEWFGFLCSPQLGGRYSGSEGIEKAVGYISSIIGESDSLTVYSFETEKCLMRNIVFHIEGEIDSLVVFGAHYDAYGYYDKTPLPGGDDNMSGTAVLLSLIKGIQRVPIYPKYSIEICFFDGEEIGRYGSNYYLNHCERGIKRYINIDTCGNKDYGLVVYYDRKQPSLQEEFEPFIQSIHDYKIKAAIYNPKGYTTDCECFESAGIPFVSIQNDTPTRHLHTKEDNVSHISFKKLNDLAVNLDQFLRTFN